MNVIFLDIDGVLNGIEYVKASGTNGLVVDPHRMKLLRKLVVATDSEIVLTISWREHWSHDPDRCDHIGIALNQLFRTYGMVIYDKTPDRNFQRDREILAWLADYPTVTGYIVLDDMTFSDPIVREHHIQTSDEAGGLTPRDIDAAIALFHA